MTQHMEVDFNVPKFLNEERKKAPAELQQFYTTFEDLYERK
jgi:26S proteasome regulatory subunit N9